MAYRPDRLTALLIEMPLFQSVHTNYNNAVDYTVDTIQKRQIDGSKLRAHAKLLFHVTTTPLLLVTSKFSVVNV